MDSNIELNIRNFLGNIDNLENFSFNFSLNSTAPVQNDIAVPVLKRRIPYIENLHINPTNTKPTMGGVHISQRTGLGSTLRYPDGLFYAMSPSYRKKGILPINKNGEIPYRCFKGDKKCKAKAMQKYFY